MYDVILFDLGRVVIGLGESPLPSQWLNKSEPLTISAWFKSPTGIEFEKGNISAEVFAQRLIDELKLEVTPEAVIKEFTAWPTQMFPAMPALLSTLRNRYRLAVLSNTNELHYPRIMNEFNIPEYFDQVFVSHLMRLAKPDVAAYQHVLNELDVDAKQVLFLDDNRDNVLAAQRVGMKAVQVCGEQEVIAALTELSVIEQEKA